MHLKWVRLQSHRIPYIILFLWKISEFIIKIWRVAVIFSTTPHLFVIQCIPFGFYTLYIKNEVFLGVEHRKTLNTHISFWIIFFGVLILFQYSELRFIEDLLLCQISLFHILLYYVEQYEFYQKLIIWLSKSERNINISINIMYQ